MKVFLIILSLSFAKISSAKVTIASINPAVESLTPSATATRNATTAGLEYLKESGEIVGTTTEVDASGYGGVFNIHFLDFQTEYWWKKKETISTTGSVEQHFEERQDHFLFGMKLFNVVYPGVTFFQDFSRQVETGDTDKETGIGAGASFQVLPYLFISGNLNIIFNERARRVNNKWAERYLGVAYQGEVATYQTQIDFSWFHKPRRKKRAQGALLINHSWETDQFRLIGGVRKGQIIAHLGLDYRSEKAPTINTRDLERTILSIGAGYFFTPELLASIEASSRKTEQNNVETKTSQVMVNVSYGFSKNAKK